MRNRPYPVLLCSIILPYKPLSQHSRNEHTSEGGRDDRGVPYHAESTLSSALVLNNFTIQAPLTALKKPTLVSTIPWVRCRALARNLGCHKVSNLYSRPTNASLLVHFVKKPLAARPPVWVARRGFYGDVLSAVPSRQHYLWDVLSQRKPHDARRCELMAGVDR